MQRSIRVALAAIQRQRLKRSETDRLEPRLEVAVINDTHAFAALEEEWDDLYHNSRRATPYQSWAWLYSWWEAYGEDHKRRDLRLITVRSEDGLLVALIPLMLERRWGFGKLLFIGSWPSLHYLDMLVRRGWEAKACEAGVEALRQMDGWHVADLRGIAQTATIWGLFEGWNGPRADLQVKPLWEIEVKPWEEVLASLSKKSRKMARRTLRSAEQDGARWVPAEDVERAARRLIALHREMRQGRGIPPERLGARYESYTVTAARRMSERGLGRISEFWRDGEVIISSFLIFYNDLTITFMVGANQEANRRYQWSTLFVWDAVNTARDRNSSFVSLLQGDEVYKTRWAKAVPYYRIHLGRNPLVWNLHRPTWGCNQAYRWLRRRIGEYVRSDTTPRWVKDVTKLLMRRGI
jgi:CelD/BcsL family acetyltransferase involved in cellulose biosynthesis